MLDIRRNTDKSLPASHVMKMTFALPLDVAGGKVISAPGVMMKFTERARGTPLSALTVKVEGSFLAGLSNRRRGSRAQYPTPEGAVLVRYSRWSTPISIAAYSRSKKGFMASTMFHEAMTAWEQPKLRTGLTVVRRGGWNTAWASKTPEN